MDEQPIIPLASPEPETPPTVTPTPASPPDPSTIPPSAPSPAGYTPPAPLSPPVSPAPDPVPPVTPEPVAGPEPIATATPAYTPPVSPVPPVTTGGKHTWVWILVLLLILGGAGGGYYYYKTRVKSGSSGSSAAKPVADPTLSWATFSTPDIPFTLRYPTGWKVAENYLLSPGIDPAKMHTSSTKDETGSSSVTTQDSIFVPVGEASFSFQDPQKEMGGTPYPTYDEIKQKSTDQTLSPDEKAYVTAMLNVLKPGDNGADFAAAFASSMQSGFAEQNKGKPNVIHTVESGKVTLGGLSVPVVTVKFKDATATDTMVTKQYFLLKDNHVYSFTAILTVNGDKDRSKEVDQIAATLKVQ